MKIVIDDMTLEKFDAWSGAVDTKQTIIDSDKQLEFERLIDDLYPEGLSGTALNDILWHEAEWVYDSLGIEAVEV